MCSPEGVGGSWCGPLLLRTHRALGCGARLRQNVIVHLAGCPACCMTTVGWTPKWTPILCGNWSCVGLVATCCRPSRGPWE
ncbi:hypothetical protein BD779DRAFT_1562174 [Infundibulicybe gibba]|nr:hypothetical protein BD779DRAFT_1562174 [Infundibulicybe gibba]